jgi:hypothetical protein
MMLLSEIQYFAPISSYVHLIGASNIVFDPYEPYQRMTFRNRMIISGANGLISLSVPLSLGRNQKGPIREVRIANRYGWQSSHWKTILSCYNRSPWFEYYRDELARLYEKHFNFLIDWDLACLEWSLIKLELPVTVTIESLPVGTMERSDQIDIRNRIRPNNYQRTKPIVYSQVFKETRGFQPNLSILDLLFCEGKLSSSALKG